MKAKQLEANLHETLPIWDLSALYQSPKDPQLTADFAEASKAAKLFKEQYDQQIESLSGDELFAAISQYEKISEC